jgi:glycosyltransferase involved in cell wall biosynthesis
MRIGGTEQVIRNIVESIDGSRFESHIFCIEQPLGPWGEELKAAGFKIASVNRQPGFDLSLIKAIRAYIKRERIDVVHCHQYTPYIYGVLAALGCGVKVVFTEHGRFYPDFGTWKRKLANPLLARFTSHITSISKATREALVEYENFNRKRIDVIYNAVADVRDKIDQYAIDALRTELGVSEGCIVFGTIARLDPIKNQEMMLQAFANTLKEVPQAILLIVGDGEIRERLEQLAAELRISNALRFVGYRNEPFQYLGLMDVYLLSSLSEGTSMTLLEAMAASKPCVVTDAGGNPEIVLDQHNGFVVPNNNAQAFSKAMIALAKDGACRESFGVAARKRYEDVFSVEKMTSAYEHLYGV